MFEWQLKAVVPFGVTPLVTNEALGKTPMSCGSSYIEVELSRMNITLGSCPVWVVKKVTSPPLSVRMVVGCTRCEMALFVRQSLALHAAASVRAGASSSRRPSAIGR